MKREVWRAYRQLKPFAQKPEGCNMEKQKQRTADPPGKEERRRFEELLEQLKDAAGNYCNCKHNARIRWADAEVNARRARAAEQEAGDFLKQCIDVMQQLAGPDTLHILRQLAAWDGRGDDDGINPVQAMAESLADQEWNEDDRLELADPPEGGFSHDE